MQKIVGVIGLGIMGGAISRNLVERGWRVIGTDLDAVKRAELGAAGVEIVDTVAGVAQAAPAIMTSLPTPAAAASVAAEIAASGAPPRIIAELSTFTLEDKLAFQKTVEAAGHTALDCPLSGTGAQAAVRDLVVYASGASPAIAKLMPLFADFSRQANDLGVFGNGSRMKYVANHLVAVHNVATAEAMLLAVKAGLDPHQTVALIGSGAGTSRMFEMRAPMMADAKYEPATMRINMWQKDMKIIGEFAKSLGVPTPLFSTTDPLYTTAQDQGLGEQDTAAVYVVLEKMMAAKG
jgi:3-hydroxyisobutyrate dehydrogenase-like beta-hydroxyacid dehydrogenase